MADKIGVSEGVKLLDGIINIKMTIKTFAEKILADLQANPQYMNVTEIKGKSIRDEGVMEYLFSVYSEDQSILDLLRLQNAISQPEKFDIEITGFLRQQFDYLLEDNNNAQQLIGVKIHNNSKGNDTYLRLEQRYRTADAVTFGRATMIGGMAKVGASGHSVLSSVRCTEPAHVSTKGLEEYVRVYSRPPSPF